MAKDMIVKAIETMLIGTPSGMAKMGPRLKNLIDKAKKDKGKPKGTGSALGIVGSASKAGMQSKQGRRIRRPNPMAPKPTGRPPKSTFFRGQANKKTNGKRGSMVVNFRTNKKAGRRAK